MASLYQRGSLSAVTDPFSSLMAHALVADRARPVWRSAQSLYRTKGSRQLAYQGGVPMWRSRARRVADNQGFKRNRGWVRTYGFLFSVALRHAAWKRPCCLRGPG